MNAWIENSPYGAFKQHSNSAIFIEARIQDAR